MKLNLLGRICDVVRRDVDVKEVVPCDGGELTDAQWQEYVRIVKAIRVFSVYTARKSSPWVLMGPQKASCRAHVMSELAGCRVPQSKSGVNAMADEFYKRANIDTDSRCRAACEDEFDIWFKEFVS